MRDNTGGRVVRAAMASLAAIALGGMAAAARADAPAPIQLLRHVIIIMQENRSFDHYFGTYPGADGIAMRAGGSAGCVPDPKRDLCLPPYHSSADVNVGGPHKHTDALADIDS